MTAGAYWHTVSWSARSAKPIPTSNFPNQLENCCQCKPQLSWGKEWNLVPHKSNLLVNQVAVISAKY